MERANASWVERVSVAVLAVCCFATWAACGRKTVTTSTPSVVPSARPKLSTARLFAIESAGSKVEFTMQAPLTKIRGEVIDAVHGEVSLNLEKLEEASGRVEVNLDRLVLSALTRKDEKHEFSESTKNEQLNREAREWLQLEARQGEIAEEQSLRNRVPKFMLDRLDDVSASNVSALSGAERNVGAKARGSLLLHGRTNKINARLSFTFAYAGDQIQSIRVKTSEPLAVMLEDYDVHPRNRVGKLVKTLAEALASDYKDTLEPRVLLDISFNAKPR